MVSLLGELSRWEPPALSLQPSLLPALEKNLLEPQNFVWPTSSTHQSQALGFTLLLPTLLASGPAPPATFSLEEARMSVSPCAAHRPQLQCHVPLSLPFHDLVLHWTPSNMP